jgi:CRISPR-associated protein Csm1
MTEKEVKLIVGALLHDLGKVIHRTGVNINHSESGYQYLKEELGLTDKEVLESVRYHHKGNLKNAKLEEASFAYITYIADNIASAADRRETTEKEDKGFEKTFPLQPVFNILNQKDGERKETYYEPKMLDQTINYPQAEKKQFSDSFYKEVLDRIKDCLRGLEWKDPRYINSLLSVLGATLFYVPSSTNKGELGDVSLYDHVKITAAVSSCLYQYLDEKGEKNYKKCLLEEETDFWKEKAFLFYSMDISGIQNFIYTIHSKDALKQLRARSFYLQIMMEHMVDTLLERLSLSRANLIYSGGGHCYILMPNTQAVKKILEEYEKDMNEWFLEKFDISLYVASGYTEVTANTLRKDADELYAQMFRNVSNKISDKKLHRYGAEDIRKLNEFSKEVSQQECRICKCLTEKNYEEGDGYICPTCYELKQLAIDIMNDKKCFFGVFQQGDIEGVPLPGNKVLVAMGKEEITECIKEEKICRVYAKNGFYTGQNVETTIYVGDYMAEGYSTFEDYAKAGVEKGHIERLGVLRADVDNLGQAFVAGFAKEYSTLSRTATLSRHLALFFQYYIRQIFAEKQRKVAIVYSGGDDVFLVGEWNEVIEASMDLQEALHKYTNASLTISAGIGIYQPAYPISRMALEVGELEDASKNYSGKNAVTLFSTRDEYTLEDGTQMDTGTYSWKELKEEVIGNGANVGKLSSLKQFFDENQERGMSMMYHMLELLRQKMDQKVDKLNIARLIYMLARLEPVKKGDSKEEEEEYKRSKEAYRLFEENIYEWCTGNASKEDIRQLITAMNWYSYLIRNRSTKSNKKEKEKER